MKSIILVLSLLLLLSLPSFGQSTERPETIVIPVSSLGEVSEVRKQILQNTLEDELKFHFRLISQERYEEVLEKVFEELDYKECNEDQCIVMIQEMLQVENVFHLQVIGEGSDTQLSLSWRTLDEKRKEEEFCEGCGTGQLRKMIGGLVRELLGKSVVEKQVVVVEKSQTGVLFQRSEKGVSKWFKDGNEKSDGKYVGEIRNGVPNGQGTLTSPNGLMYVGEFKNGKGHGQGTFTSPDGIQYHGEWKDGKIDGQGTLTSPDGKKYDGEWKDNKMDGQGTMVYPDGGKYVGEWENGKRNGQGIHTYDGTKNVGEWNDGKPWNGTITDKNGNITGKWVNGLHSISK